ncbi:hypothetical protein cypCar_00025138 [Cyprinus carpio]|nr:hypothetical protein cypCar_00025138 [Cyprinus carpio]
MTSDKKASAKVIISVIDVNNNGPEFKQTSYKASIDENMPIGTSVLTVKATDLDSGENGYVTYSIANVNPQPFVIDYFSGVISSSEILNYELMPRIYNLKVRASDWGSPFRREVETQVTVTLNNLNDNKPLFENVDCDVTVPRDHGVSEHITTVSAIDADELQLQSLSEGEAAKAFYHSLQIIASDGEHETLPMFLNITVVTARKPVQVKCVDTGVASMLAEKLLKGSKIHSQNEPEDHFQDFHSVNRVAPQFAETFPSVIEVKEDLPVGARIVHLSATDSDSGFNGKLVYVISGGDTESRFVIDMDSGWLKVYAPLDRETTDHYTLNITVYDLGIPQKSSSRLLDVKILDANDISPQFLQDAYSVDISESTAVGTEIIQVEAKDKDLGDNGVVRYSILADTDQFAIDMETGIVTVKKPLDREVQPSFILKIAARDQATGEPQLVSTVLLKITLEDVNDNPPKFIPPNYQVRVREDLPIGTVIMWLEAHDPDVGPSSQVRYSLADNGDGKFEVDKLSGAVRIVQNLDYEKKQVYSLTARAKDKGKPISLSSSCHIEVEVVDINENLYRPLFPSYVDKGFIKEDVPIGTSVMKITAQDEDKGRDGEIRYSIRDGSGLGIFTIDEETGLLRGVTADFHHRGGNGPTITDGAEGGHSGPVNSVQWHPEDSVLYSGSDDTHIAEWDLQTGKVRCKWKADRSAVSSLCISPDGKLLLSAGMTIKMWNLETKEVYRVRSDGKDKNSVVSFTLTDEPQHIDLQTSNCKDEPVRLAVVCKDGQLHLFEHFLNGPCKKPLSPVCSLQVSTMKGDSPVPVPLLAAALRADRQNLMLAYGHHLQPVMEKTPFNTSERHICLVRDVHGTLSLSVDTAVSKVKTPVVNKQSKVLVPGLPGHKAPIKLTPNEAEKRKKEDSTTEMSIEERLEQIELSVGGRDDGKGTSSLQTDSFAVLLVQGLESNDQRILAKIFQTKKEMLIKNTVARLPPQAVLPLLEELSRRLQGHPFAALLIVQWFKAVLTQHTSYLSSLPDLVSQLGSIYHMIESRVKLYQQLTRLHGKLYLLMTQVATNNSAKNVDNISHKAKLVYEEESSDEDEDSRDEGCPEDDSDNWEEDEAAMELTEDKKNHKDEEDDEEDDMNDESKANGDSDLDPENESEEE